MMMEQCPKCKKFMVCYLITTPRSYWYCPSCGYDTKNDESTFYGNLYTITIKEDMDDQSRKH